LSLLCDGFHLKLETVQIWQYIKNTAYKKDIKIILLLKVQEDFFFPPNDRYIDCSSLTYVTNKSKTLKLQYRY